jgi:hypothetical protein
MPLVSPVPEAVGGMPTVDNRSSTLEYPEKRNQGKNGPMYEHSCA